MTPVVSIYRVKRQWVMSWLLPSGLTDEAFYPSRKALCDALPEILSQVRGQTFPLLPKADEVTITLWPFTDRG